MKQIPSPPGSHPIKREQQDFRGLEVLVKSDTEGGETSMIFSYPKNHGISRLVVWRSRNSAIESQTPP